MLLQTTYHCARVYQGGEIVAPRARVTIGRDMRRLGLTASERAFVALTFTEGCTGRLHRQLRKLVDRRGAAAARIAESLDPIVVVVSDPHHGELTVEGRLQPPEIRVEYDLHDVEFKVREDIDPGSQLPSILVGIVIERRA